jgi:hypothetical protein
LWRTRVSYCLSLFTSPALDTSLTLFVSAFPHCSLQVQSGLSDSLRAPPPPSLSSSFIPPFPPFLPFLTLDPRLSPGSYYPINDYNYIANLHLNAFLSTSLSLAHGLDQETTTEELRTSFLSFWRPQLESWRARWSDVSELFLLAGSFPSADCPSPFSFTTFQTLSSVSTPRTTLSCSSSCLFASKVVLRQTRSYLNAKKRR